MRKDLRRTHLVACVSSPLLGASTTITIYNDCPRTREFKVWAGTTYTKRLWPPGYGTAVFHDVPLPLGSMAYIFGTDPARDMQLQSTRPRPGGTGWLIENVPYRTHWTGGWHALHGSARVDMEYGTVLWHCTPGGQVTLSTSQGTQDEAADAVSLSFGVPGPKPPEASLTN